jgi:hypothetical protein
MRTHKWLLTCLMLGVPEVWERAMNLIGRGSNQYELYDFEKVACKRSRLIISERTATCLLSSDSLTPINNRLSDVVSAQHLRSIT